MIYLTVDNEVLGFKKKFCSWKVKDFYVHSRIDWVNGVISNPFYLHDNYEYLTTEFITLVNRDFIFKLIKKM